MIKINLLGDSTAVDNSAKMKIAAYLGSILFTILIFYFVQSSLSQSIEDLTARVQRKESDLTRIQKVTKDVRDLEAKKAEYNSKLVVIATLKKNKMGPVRVLDDLNGALPEKAWLSDIKEKEGTLSIKGRALDEQTFASFIRELAKSDYFGDQSNQILKQFDKDGVKIKEFSFDSKIYYSGKLVAQQVEAIKAAQAAFNANQAPPPAPGKKG